MDKYQVIVGNIGTVHDGPNRYEAERDYAEYVDQSQSGYGRASGEDVTLMLNGEPICEYVGGTVAKA